MRTEPLYEIRDLRVWYPAPRGFAHSGAPVRREGRGGPSAQPAIEIGSLSIGEGGVTALVGPNGSGKTTLLKALNGLVRVGPGSILYRGEDASASGRLRAESVYLHQTPYILSGSVSYNVCFGPRARSAGRRESAERAGRAMEALGLSGYGRRHHRALSGGEAQRVGLARALATGASVYLLDEPTASVDAESRKLIIDTMLALAAGGATVVLSTHDERLAGILGARVVALESGRLAQAGGVS